MNSWASLTEMPRSLPRLKAPLPYMMPKLMAFAEERICPVTISFGTPYILAAVVR